MNSMPVKHNYIKAGHPDTPVNELRKLLSDSCAKVRWRIAQNPNAPEDLLVALSQDKDVEVRIAVGRNPGCPPNILQKLLNDDSIAVRFGLAADPYLSREALNILAQDENPYVVDQANRTLEGLALEDALKEHGFVHHEGVTDRLGEILCNSGFITDDQLNQFLRLSLESGLPLGRTIVQARALPRAIIVAALNLQTKVRKGETSHESVINQMKQLNTRQV
jgi:hypothetical protein